MSLVDQVREAGVVGAGGGGFPTHVKLAAKADTVIANGAECEPLLHKDAALMELRAEAIVRGMVRAMEAVGAAQAIIGIKAKKLHAVEAVREAIKGTPVRLHLLGDYYPAGDEYDLVYETTGRLIPPAGIPINVGAIVCNVETFANIDAAAAGTPVTHKTVTLAGAVKRPVTVTVPVGTTFRAAIDAAGGLATDDPILCCGGLMMGTRTDDLDTPIVKTTTGAVILPRAHHVVERKLKDQPAMDRIGKSGCDQCRFCTELCPRYILGYAVEPHQVMRSLVFTKTGKAVWNELAALCCACGLCTLFSCPEELYPKEACDEAKLEIRKSGVKLKWAESVKPHPMREGRHVPIATLTRRLAVEQYDLPAPWEDIRVEPAEVFLPLKQNAGAPGVSRVKPGDRVRAGDLIARPPEGALGAPIHASIDGVVAAVTDDLIVIERAI